MEADNKLVQSFSETILNDSTKDVSVDMLEASFDTLFESEIIKDIPIVSTIMAIGKTGIMLKNRNLIRQTLQFMHELNNGTIINEKKEKFVERIKNGDKKSQKEVDRIMLILESTIDLEKSTILAKFVVAYINEQLSYTEFQELTDTLSRSYLSDMEMLLKIHSGQIKDTSSQELYRIERLAGLGFINRMPYTVTVGSEYTRQESYLEMSYIGNLFCEIGRPNIPVM
ncbi:hypothetical protein LMF32_00050 [Desemzia sp. C1]|uniref:hypothetical protein n=1 Tax=Desemzia sp. C1 TaxID=2892016 RepID=UPI001E42E2DF|nr:hypothetical protein [Desemzia sp. C1]MCI3027527.1 hypothetical protein [Desemzia sp. C1]